MMHTDSSMRLVSWNILPPGRSLPTRYKLVRTPTIIMYKVMPPYTPGEIGVNIDDLFMCSKAAFKIVNEGLLDTYTERLELS